MCAPQIHTCAKELVKVGRIELLRTRELGTRSHLHGQVEVLKVALEVFHEI
jgi:hypothetical protein